MASHADVNMNVLPTDVMHRIASHLDRKTVKTLGLCNRSMRKLAIMHMYETIDTLRATAPENLHWQLHKIPRMHKYVKTGIFELGTMIQPSDDERAVEIMHTFNTPLGCVEDTMNPGQSNGVSDLGPLEPVFEMSLPYHIARMKNLNSLTLVMMAHLICGDSLWGPHTQDDDEEYDPCPHLHLRGVKSHYQILHTSLRGNGFECLTAITLHGANDTFGGIQSFMFGADSLLISSCYHLRTLRSLSLIGWKFRRLPDCADPEQKSKISHLRLDLCCDVDDPSLTWLIANCERLTALIYIPHTLDPATAEHLWSLLALHEDSLRELNVPLHAFYAPRKGGSYPRLSPFGAMRKLAFSTSDRDLDNFPEDRDWTEEIPWVIEELDVHTAYRFSPHHKEEIGDVLVKFGEKFRRVFRGLEMRHELLHDAEGTWEWHGYYSREGVGWRPERVREAGMHRREEDWLTKAVEPGRIDGLVGF